MQGLDAGDALVKLVDLAHALFEMIDLTEAMTELVEVVDPLLDGGDPFECLGIGPARCRRRWRHRRGFGGGRSGCFELDSKLRELGLELGDLRNLVLDAEQPVLESVDLCRQLVVLAAGG